MSAIFHREDAERLLARLAPPSDQFLEIRVIVPDGAVSQFYCKSVAEALHVVERHSGIANVYIGACPRFRTGGKKDDVNTVVGFWADLDFHPIDPNRDVAFELAYRNIEKLEHRPTILVHTGNGLQGWWCFPGRVQLGEEFTREQFEAVNRGLATLLGGDHVQDVARVLRVPGTLNVPTAKKRARGCAPVIARLLDAAGPTYQPEDFVGIAVYEPNAARGFARPIPVPRTNEDTTDIVEAFAKLLRQVSPSHPLAQVWAGQRRLNDCSRSGWDMALVCQLYRAHVREEFIPAIVRAFPFGRGVFATDDYVARTMAKGRLRYRGLHETPRSA